LSGPFIGEGILAALDTFAAVFKASEAQMIDVIGDMTRGACEVNKGQVQAFIN